MQSVGQEEPTQLLQRRVTRRRQLLLLLLLAAAATTTTRAAAAMQASALLLLLWTMSLTPKQTRRRTPCGGRCEYQWYRLPEYTGDCRAAHRIWIRIWQVAIWQ